MSKSIRKPFNRPANDNRESRINLVLEDQQIRTRAGSSRQRSSMTMIVGIILFSFVAVVVNSSTLDWSVRSMKLKADTAQRSVVVVFPFKNTGDRMVVVTSIIPSCGCLTPKLAKDFFAPGESGELHAEFVLAGRSGRSEETITVTTDDMPRAPVVLKLIVDLPEPVTLSARSVFWRVGEPVGEKLIEVAFAEPDKSTLDGVQCSETSFALRLEPGATPGRHRILIRPVTTAALAQAPIRLAATINGQHRILILQAGVR